MNMIKRLGFTAFSMLFVALFSLNALAITIDNGLATNAQGYWSVDVTDGGESREAYLTATGTPSGTIFENEEIVYDYFSYIDAGAGGVRLSATAVTTPAYISGPGEVTSAGEFLDPAGALIYWLMVSTIEPGSSVMVNELTLTASVGTLGQMLFFQYLDEDVLGSGDDFFFTRGTLGTDLELFTIDDAEAIGVSHSGAQSGAQGLANAVNAGWAMCDYNSMKSEIEGGTQSVTPDGVVCPDVLASASSHPIAGQGYGPFDIVSSMAWSVDPTESTATIVTTLGGVPDIRVVTGENVAVPTLDAGTMVLLVLLLGGVGILVMRRQGHVA